MNWTLAVTLIQIVVYVVAIVYQKRRITLLEANALSQSQTIKDITSSISAQKQLTDSMNSFLERVQSGRMDDIASANQHIEWNKQQQQARVLEQEARVLEQEGELKELHEKFQAQFDAVEKADASANTTAILKVLSEQVLGLEEKILARNQMPDQFVMQGSVRGDSSDIVRMCVQNSISLNLHMGSHSKTRGGTLEEAGQWTEQFVSAGDIKRRYDFLLIYFGEAVFRKGVFDAVKFYFDNEYVPYRGQLSGNS